MFTYTVLEITPLDGSHATCCHGVYEYLSSAQGEAQKQINDKGRPEKNIVIFKRLKNHRACRTIPSRVEVIVQDKYTFDD